MHLQLSSVPGYHRGERTPVTIAYFDVDV